MAAAEKVNRQKFGLAWPGIVALVVYALASLTKVDWSHEDAQRIGMRLGIAMWIGFLVCLLLAVPAFYIGRRSRRAATWTYCIAMLLLTAHFVRSPSSGNSARAVSQELNEVSKLNAQYTALGKQIQQIQGSGGARLDSPAVVASGIQIVNKAIQVNKAILTMGTEAEAQLAKQLRDSGAAELEIASAVANLRGQLKWDRHRPLCELEGRILADYLRTLELLQTEAGHYSAAPSMSAFQFERPDSQHKFASLLDDMRTAVAKEHELSTSVASTD